MLCLTPLAMYALLVLVGFMVVFHLFFSIHRNSAMNGVIYEQCMLSLCFPLKVTEHYLEKTPGG